MMLDELRSKAYKKQANKSEDLTEKKLDNVMQTLKKGGLLKVPVSSEENVYRRVAKFLLVIGVDEAAKVMQHLSEEQTERIIPELASIQSVSEEEKSAIMQEFHGLLQQSRESGGVEAAREILTKAYGGEKADALIKSSVQFPQGKPFAYLNEANSDKVFALLKDEAPTVKALVLSRIDSQKAADVISKLDVASKKEVITRLAKMQSVLPDVIKKTDEVIYEKFISYSPDTTDAIDGKAALAEILRRLPSSSEDEILEHLSKEDPTLEEDLRSRLFTLDDVENADDRFVQEKLRSMTDKEIAFLIAAKKETFRKKILHNVSTGRGDTILEEEQLAKPMRKKDCDDATSAFLRDLRTAYEEGKFRVKGRDDEEYVE